VSAKFAEELASIRTALSERLHRFPDEKFQRDFPELTTAELNPLFDSLMASAISQDAL
jgi:hypothetical protein